MGVSADKMVRKVAFLFPGQGSQYAGMGKSLYDNYSSAKEVFDGHSLGEYSAIVSAGGLALTDALPVVQLRGRFMQDAVQKESGMMAALLGISRSDVIDVCKSVTTSGEDIVTPANFNPPEH